MKKPNDIVVALNKILNDAFCQHTHHRAYKVLQNLRPYISTDEYQTLHKHLIWTDTDNPDVWNGTQGITRHEKYQYTLFAEYVKMLIEKYK